MFESFQKYIPRAAQAYGIGKEVKAAQVCRYFRNIIPAVFKHIENPEKYIDAASFRENYLLINVENPAWASEVVMRKEEIIRAINQEAGSQVIKNLRTQLKQIN